MRQATLHECNVLPNVNVGQAIPIKEETVRCLEIGPGEDPLDGFETLDVIDHPGTTYVAEWGHEPLPIPKEMYDFVFASHVLEHVSWNRTQNALLEVKRVLKPNGRLELWVPNFAFIVDCYLRNICGDDWRRDNPEADHMTWVNGRIFTYGPGEENRHRACFDEPFLHRSLEQAGFGNVQRISKRTLGIGHGPIDLGMQGVKPQSTQEI